MPTFNAAFHIAHKFRTVGSDKTPMKLSLMCETCTDLSGNSTYCAYGVDTLSWGLWKKQAKPQEEELTNDE